ncbi:MAG: MATE family efflux transporter, partial [Candidatus Granulicatella sp. P6S_S16_bin.50.1]|nr:MATE family efflux transporter [Candidatus Granulicatella sp. P6S_S16_bin.50.1]
MAIPAIVANVVNALYNIVDQIFIGQGVGYLGNAATNIAFPITTICMAIGLMVGIGA